MFSPRYLHMQSRIYVSSKNFNSSFSTSSRPIAKFDVSNGKDSDSQTSELNPKGKHLGVFSHSTVKLPEQLKKAVDKILSSCTDTNLSQNAEILKNHLIFKKPPLTETKLQEIKVRFTEKLSAAHPSPDILFLSAEDEKKIQNTLKSKIQKVVSQNTYRWKPVIYNEAVALTYLVARIAPEYATLYQIFQEICSRDQNFQPQTLFDFGSGIGSALWSAKSCWGDKKFKEVFCVDSSVDMNNLALALIQGGVWPNKASDFNPIDLDEKEFSSTIKGLYFRQFMPASSAVKYDLVVCAHSLLELPSAELRLQIALSLWRKSQGYLVFVEHGSRAAFEVIMEVRDFLLSLSEGNKESNLQGYVFAPCPNKTRCPRLAETTPCNFEVKYEPLQINQRIQKERYSYLVLKKGQRPDEDLQWPRVVRPVLVRSGHVICRLCTQEGKLEEIVITRAKNSKLENLMARRTKWGDLLPVQLSRPDTTELECTLEDEKNL
ncbi:methyltransferase-like protein 17, mitochondrial [Daphnia pulicaria]|uniref:methyltransferase-like protein 17, mitochondrial n=1 Tax=Daphnia pulicaria TaxID=35523 RepID=UPI001EEC1D6D|nr:methyltransferase-like protein 17, mitochondrial [Daphnia pulicaria]